MKKINLTRGLVALVDNDIYEDISKYKWHALLAEGRKEINCGKSFYASRHKPGEHKKLLLMHREIFRMKYGVEPKYIDHINGDKLDNRIENLRECSCSQNVANSFKRNNNNSGYKGVYFEKESGKYKAQIHYHGKVINLGRFLVKEEAAMAYDEAAKIVYGEFANVNFLNNERKILSRSKLDIFKSKERDGQ